MEYCDKCGYIKPQCQCEKPMTNADRIRNMTDEELALFLIRAYNGILVHMKCTSCMDREKACHDCFEKWLQAEVKEGAENE